MSRENDKECGDWDEESLIALDRINKKPKQQCK